METVIGIQEELVCMLVNVAKYQPGAIGLARQIIGLLEPITIEIFMRTELDDNIVRYARGIM